MIDILHFDKDIIVCIKPSGVLSTDEAGGLPELLRAQLGGEVFTVHRLDRVVGGLMLLARSKGCASALSRQVMERSFGKEYFAVVHGCPEERAGTLIDLLYRDKRECKTYVTDTPGKGVQEAVLDYELLGSSSRLSLISIALRTGRTHQIRAQFSSRGFPLVGDRKYSTNGDNCDIALWSQKVGFLHPQSCEYMEFAALPPTVYPWSEFQTELTEKLQ